MASASNSTSLDSSIGKVFIYKKLLRLIRFFTKYYELKLFLVFFHGIAFKSVQNFINVMFQIL